MGMGVEQLLRFAFASESVLSALRGSSGVWALPCQVRLRGIVLAGETVQARFQWLLRTGLGGSPDDKLKIDDELPGWRGRTSNSIQHGEQCGRSDLQAGLPDGGQRGLQQLRILHVVNSGDADLCGNLDPNAGKGSQELRRGMIVGADDRVGLHLIQKVLDPGHIVGIDPFDQRLRRRLTVVVQRFLVTADSGVHGMS